MTRRILSYDPAAGHTDQLRSLSLALAVARLLERALLLPNYYLHDDATVYTNSSRHAELTLTRPSISSILSFRSSDVTIVDSRKLRVLMHELPRCTNNSSDAAATACVHWTAPPPHGESVRSFLQGLAALSNKPYLHFSSMLDSLPARRKKRFPLASWEGIMVPSDCAFSYSLTASSMARKVLRKILPVGRQEAYSRGVGHERARGDNGYIYSRSHGVDVKNGSAASSSMPCGRNSYLAAHVRAEIAAKFKSERISEWLPRLFNFTLNATASCPPHLNRPTILYLATDSPESALPAAKEALADLGVQVVSAERQGMLPSSLASLLAIDTATAALLLDTTAILEASAFTPSPRSGLSVHWSAMRACARGQSCDPAAATCTPFASSGCGGWLPSRLLEVKELPVCPRCCPSSEAERRHLCVLRGSSRPGVERSYSCP